MLPRNDGLIERGTHVIIATMGVSLYVAILAVAVGLSFMLTGKSVIE